MSLPEVLPPLVCCIPNCQRTAQPTNGGQALEAGWDIEQDESGKEYALCPKCRDRQEAQDERLSQRMGRAPKDVPPRIEIQAASIEEQRKVVSDAEKSGVIKNTPGIGELRARLHHSETTQTPSVVQTIAKYKLVSLEVKMGDQVLSTIELTPEVKSKLNLKEDICQIL